MLGQDQQQGGVNMELIVFWIICGAVAAVIVSSKGGSGLLGFAVGGLLGPIGIIVAFFLGDPKNQAEQEIASGEKKKCPQCAELVLAEARICKHCRSPFNG